MTGLNRDSIRERSNVESGGNGFGITPPLPSPARGEGGCQLCVCSRGGLAKANAAWFSLPIRRNAALVAP